MCKRFEEWSDDIRRFCERHGYSFEKASKLSKCWGKDDLILQYFDPEAESVKKGLGLRDETPMPVVLAIYKRPDGLLLFEQTEHTKKYLTDD